MKNKTHEKYVKFNIKDKDRAMKHFEREILSKTTQIFEYTNLPEELKGLEPILETFLQKNGNVFFHKVDGKLYFFTGGLGGEYDAYYRPTIYTIANPYLNYTTQAEIGVDGVLMKNDTFNEGLLPIIQKYGILLIESNISINNAIVNTRDFNTFSAQDDKTKASAELYQKKIVDGDYAVIGESALLEGLKRHPTPPLSGTMTELKELRQYIKAQLFSDLGLKTAHNMKSQYVSDSENIINDDTLLPLVQDMLRSRRQAIEEINEMYDLNIEVDLSGTWKLQQEKVNLELEQIEKGNLPLNEPYEPIEEHEVLEGQTHQEDDEGAQNEDLAPQSEDTSQEVQEEEPEQETQEEEPEQEVQDEEPEESDVDVDVTVNVEINENPEEGPEDDEEDDEDEEV